MARNSSGTYSRRTPPGPGGYVGGVGNKIYASQVNGEYNDIGAEITDSVSRSGKGAALANLPMGGFKHTGAAEGTTNGEYVTYEQIFDAITGIANIISDPIGTGRILFGNVVPSTYLLVPTAPATVLIADYPDLYAYLVTNSGYVSTAFTVTIATPGVFTSSAHGFLGGEKIRLSTTGALPTGLGTTTDYFVLYLDANTFKLSLTDGGTAINTTGTQSGTHHYLQTNWGFGDGSTTFNIPWMAEDESWVQAGLDHVGTHQNGQVLNHTHTYSAPAFPQNYTTGATAQAITGASSTATSNPVSGGGTTNKPAGNHVKWIIKAKKGF